MKKLKDLLETLKILTIAAITLCLFLSSIFLGIFPPSNKEDAKRVLEQSGYTNITFPNVSGRFRCGGGGELYATPFKAKSIAGTEVKGTVCRGVTSGSTIRL